jgi:hypothetical protein
MQKPRGAARSQLLLIFLIKHRLSNRTILCNFRRDCSLSRHKSIIYNNTEATVLPNPMLRSRQTLFMWATAQQTKPDVLVSELIFMFTNLLHGAESFLRGCQSLSRPRNFSPSMDPVHYHVHKSQKLDPILSIFNPAHTQFP